MKITYHETALGRVTRVQDTDENGVPMASSFTGWISEQEIKQKLAAYRKATS